MNEHPAFLVFYGTLTTIVRAADEDAAFDAFLGALNPPRKKYYWDSPEQREQDKSFGRYVPPIRDEVTIRRPPSSDRAWIEDSGDAAFLALLPELESA